MVASAEVDRDRGVISKADRRFLLMTPEEREEEYTRQARDKRIGAIRERLENAVLDFSLLIQHLDDQDIEDALTLFETHELPGKDLPQGVVGGTSTEHLEQKATGMADLLGFVYYVTTGSGVQVPSQYGFDRLLRRGIRSARNRQYGGDAPVVDIDFEVKELPESAIDEILEKIETGAYDDLTEGEARIAVRTIMESEETPSDLARRAWIERLEHLAGRASSDEDTDENTELGEEYHQRVEEARERRQVDETDESA